MFVSGTVCSSCTCTYWYVRVILSQYGKEFPIERKWWASDLNSEIRNRFSSLLIFSSPADGSTICPSLEIVHVFFQVFFRLCNYILGKKKWLVVVTFSAICWDVVGDDKDDFQWCPVPICSHLWRLPKDHHSGDLVATDKVQPACSGILPQRLRRCVTEPHFQELLQFKLCTSGSSHPDLPRSPLCAGAAIRHCDVEQGWLEPELYNCTSPPFVELNAAVSEDYRSIKIIEDTAAGLE